MKEITNWKKATVCDFEADNLLDDATLLHVLSYEMANKKSDSIKGSDKERIIKFLNWHIDNKIPLVQHNGVLYDTPLCEKLLGIDLSKLMVIDTLALSWYLNTKREMHNLDSFFEDYGIEKPKVSDWENLTYEEYRYRCEEDVKINVALWEDFKKRLHEMYTITKSCVDSGRVCPKRMSSDEETYLDQYVNSSTVDEYIDRCLTFLMFKMDCARLQEKTRWKVDVNYLQESFNLLDKKVKETLETLESVMPPVPKYGYRKKPEEPLKKDGSPKQTTLRWNDAVANLNKKDEYGNPLTKIVENDENRVQVIIKYEKPNGNSQDQLKKFFFSHGWKPQTFKFVKDKDAMEAWVKGGFKKAEKPVPRKIPQISKDGEDGKELCPSLKKLIDEVPEIGAYDGYSVAKHRYDTAKGFQRDMSEDGYLRARIGGFTNTLRVKHREIVNLVGVDKPYGENVRGVLTCADDEILLGSDLSSLEDRTKHHFMLPHDPSYVETMMADDYDPHILTAHAAGLITDKELEDFKAGIKEEHVGKARKSGKATNYACLPNSFTQVLTPEGFKWLDEVNVGDTLIGNVGGQDINTKVLNVQSLLKQEVYKVCFKSGTFFCTKEHTWVTKEGFVHTDDLMEGDIVNLGDGDSEFLGFEYSHKEDVSCVSTDTNTFYMKQYGETGLTGNCVYGGSPEAISRSAGVDLETAKKLHKGYWELNWSVKAIAEEQCVFEDSRKQKWLINPINGICYSLRTEKDRFSTLAQGSGSFFFDMWVDRILHCMMERFKAQKLTGSFHDEVIICFKDSKQGKILMSKLVTDAIDYVTNKYKLRRKLGCDVQFGTRYSQIH